MDVEGACGDAKGEGGGTCIDRPQKLLQVVHGVGHVGYVDPVAVVAVGKGMLQCLESVVGMVGASMDDAHMVEVEDDQKLLGCKDRSATVKQATTADLEEFPLIASFALAGAQLESISVLMKINCWGEFASLEDDIQTDIDQITYIFSMLLKLSLDSRIPMVLHVIIGPTWKLL